MSSVLQHTDAEFDERNVVLFLLLGALSACDRLDRLLAQHAPEREPAERSDAPLDDVTLALLGAIRLRDDIRGLVPAKVESPSPPPETYFSSREILR